MSTHSPFKIGLEPKILDRAKLILGSLFLIFTIVTIAGVHQGIASGDFERVLLNPLRKFVSELEKSEESNPIVTPTPFENFDFKTNVEININQITPTPQVIKYTTPVTNCIRKNIREGEFASNKCYIPQDYEDLEYYLGRFNSSVFERDSAEATMRITCSGSDFFKDSCERDKKRKAEAEANINNYKGIIHGIIAKGK